MISETLTSQLDFKKIRVGGLSIRVAISPMKEASAGSSNRRLPLLLINGLGASVELLAPFIEEMSERELILFDAPGVGKSQTPMLPPRMPQLARTAMRVCEQLGYSRIDVLGLSWGGALAQQMAYSFPLQVKHLILVATSSGSMSVPGRPQALNKIIHPKRYLETDYVMMAAEQIYGGADIKDRAVLERYFNEIGNAQKSRGYLWQLYAMMSWTSIHWLHSLRQPTLILSGKDDPLIPLENARLLSQKIPHSRMVVVDGGHLFLLTHAREMAETISQFLSDKRAFNRRFKPVPKRTLTFW